MRIIINSVPKSGTHLVEKALQLLGVSHGEPLPLSGAASDGLGPRPGEATIAVGVGMPVQVSAARLRARLEGLATGQVITAHVLYSDAMREMLESLGFRMLVALRDPRDVAVSLAFHIAREKAHRLHARFASMPSDEQLMATICGYREEGHVLLESVGERFASVMPWLDWRAALLVRFEDLVGTSGGGDAVRQMETLSQIAARVDAPAPDMAAIAKQLFGRSATFRRGTTQQWREHFTAQHHAALEQVAPGLVARLGY